MSFPEHPSKSRLSLLIIEIIALKDKHHRLKTTKTVIELELKPEKFLLLESSKYLHNEWECVVGYIKTYLKFVVRVKIIIRHESEV